MAPQQHKGCAAGYDHVVEFLLKHKVKLTANRAGKTPQQLCSSKHVHELMDGYKPE